MNYTETNKLIAEFMGYESYKFRGYTMFVYEKNNHRADIDLHYHTSWDWLMPVVDKIEDIRFDNEDKNSFVSHHKYDVDTRGIGCTITDVQEGKVVGYGDCATKRDSTYQAIIEFIKNQ